MYVGGPTEVQNNLDVVQLLKRSSASFFSMNDSEQGIIGGYLSKNEEDLTETIIFKADSN